jgi:hypothetical protein
MPPDFGPAFPSASAVVVLIGLPIERVFGSAWVQGQRDEPLADRYQPENAGDLPGVAVSYQLMAFSRKGRDLLFFSG